MPFGLRERASNLSTPDEQGWRSGRFLVYMDNVVIFSDDCDVHLDRIEKLFDCLGHAHLTVNLAKCKFAQATVSYLGGVVGRGSVCPVCAMVQAIDDYAPPPTKKELMYFLGLVGYYRCFCRNSSTVVEPLTNLLKAQVAF